ncbi:hypothetical protein [Streptomyces nymphaeiformis]|uniref:Uncharacterized protein n=1 Tax=Streptomyces nymphaeiformis TaxID=2663842 RepID=A0A7W7XDP8_9ACTN|nr:hypothetical protein [Streptomyces nymphaeiformis]MBB4984979.1 hypothetical protein [Streptomyces nymphaeiformis]
MTEASRETTTSFRFRIHIRYHDRPGWTVWGRFSSNAQRTYRDASWLLTQPDIAEVDIQCTTTVEEHLTLDELRACVASIPTRSAPAQGDPA